MSDFFIPDELKQIRQPNRGDVFGELWATFNIDLSTNPGKIKVSKKLGRVLDDLYLDNDIEALDVFDGFYYALDNETLWECAVEDDPRDVSNWSENAEVGSTDGLEFGFESDMVSFEGQLLLSQSEDIASLVPDDSFAAQWWTEEAGGESLQSGVPHILHTHQGGQTTLFVTDGHYVRYYNFTAGHSAVHIGDDFIACCIAGGVSATWVGTYTERGDKCYVYEMYVGEQIDGTPVARQAYPIDCRAILSIVVVDNIPYVVTDKGAILVFNGAGFVPHSQTSYFPFAYGSTFLDGVQSGLVQDASISRPVHPKGMKARNRSILIALNSKSQGDAGDPVNERTPSGVWEYNLDTQVLNHKQSFTTASNFQHGIQIQSRSGPLLVIDSPYSSILVAGEADSGNIGLFAETDEDAPQGYIITAEIESDVVKDSFEKVFLKAKTLGEYERIVLKYRKAKEPSFPIYCDITWSDETTFTTTDPAFSQAADGHEIEVTEKWAAGNLAHIIGLSEDAGTFTVVIDEPIGNGAATSRIRVQNWTKLAGQDDAAVYTAADGELKEIGVDEVLTWVQYKLQLSGEIELRQFRSQGNAQQ